MRGALKMFTRAAKLAACVMAMSAASLGLAQAQADRPASGVYAVDPNHHALILSYSHLGLSRPSFRFDNFSANLTLDADHPANDAVDAIIQIASMHTGVPALDTQLTGARFFDAANFPTAHFHSTQVTLTGATTAVVVGDLTIKNVTHPITLNVSFNRAAINPMTGRQSLGFSASGELDRSQWGLGALGQLVSDQVKIDIEAEFARAPG
jgi:polyisoprenoid-binding protein YceI